MTLAAAEPDEEPLAEWIIPALTIKRDRDPLGLQTITLDRIMPALLPGVLALSERARYLTIYPFLLWLPRASCAPCLVSRRQEARLRGALDRACHNEPRAPLGAHRPTITPRRARFWARAAPAGR